MSPTEYVPGIWHIATQVGNNDDEPETEIQHHICMFPNGDKYDGGFLVQRFRSHGSTDFRLERREGNGTYTEADGSRYGRQDTRVSCNHRCSDDCCLPLPVRQ